MYRDAALAQGVGQRMGLLALRGMRRGEFAANACGFGRIGIAVAFEGNGVAVARYR